MHVFPDDLLETLRDAQRFGFFGRGAVEDAAQHATAYIDALDDVLSDGAHVVDLGSGGGLPGLVIASLRPSWQLTMIDRRRKRTDFLERAVRRHRWQHVDVIADDVGPVVDAVNDGDLKPFDAATARSFGPPEFTLRTGHGLTGGLGAIVISEPPEGERWPTELLDELQMQSVRLPLVRCFQPRSA